MFFCFYSHFRLIVFLETVCFINIFQFFQKLSREISIPNASRIMTFYDKIIICRIHIAKQEKEDAYGRLEQIQKEREKMDLDMDEINIELMELKKYVTEESIKLDVR